MRVLVAGDRGYIGAVLVLVLRAAGHEVDGLDDFVSSRFCACAGSASCYPSPRSTTYSTARPVGNFRAGHPHRVRARLKPGLLHASRDRHPAGRYAWQLRRVPIQGRLNEGC